MKSRANNRLLFGIPGFTSSIATKTISTASVLKMRHVQKLECICMYTEDTRYKINDKTTTHNSNNNPNSCAQDRLAKNISKLSAATITAGHFLQP